METIVQKSRQESEKEKVTQPLIALSLEEEEYYRKIGENLYSTLGLNVPQFVALYLSGIRRFDSWQETDD